MDGGDDPSNELSPYTPIRGTLSGGSPLGRNSSSGLGRLTPDSKNSGTGKPPTSPPSSGGNWPWAGKRSDANGYGTGPSPRGSTPRRGNVSDETKAFDQVVTFWSDNEKRATVDDINRCRVELDRAKDSAQASYILIQQLIYKCYAWLHM